MNCVAKYIGKTEKFGVNPGELREISLKTYETEHGSPYIWVKALDGGDYLMPYHSMVSLLRDWEFMEYGLEDEVQNDLEAEWAETYIIEGAVCGR